MPTITWTNDGVSLQAEYNGFSLAINATTGLDGKEWYSLIINGKVYTTQPSPAKATEFAELLRPFMDNPISED